jgi:hypothetical protein
MGICAYVCVKYSDWITLYFYKGGVEDKLWKPRMKLNKDIRKEVAKT